MYEYHEIKELIGKTFTRVTDVGGDELLFEGDEGSYRFYHVQDCYENVRIEDITGDLDDLVGSPIICAEERCENAAESEEVYESGTWTFYEFRTIKGSVTVRWLGTSNGYYSESVSFGKV